MNFSQFKDTYQKNGYCVIPDALSESELSELRTVVDILLQETPQDGGGKFHDIGLGEARRFLRHRHDDFPKLKNFLFSENMYALVSTFIGSRCYLFNEQFVVKGAQTGAGFAWHQDSAYVGFPHKPYLTAWIALDDTVIDNGCLYVLPKALGQGTIIEPHHWDTCGKELVGYHGDDPGIGIECRSGTIVAFSSLLLHRSGPNITQQRRRAYICQYAPEVIVDPATKLPKHFSKPLISN